MDDDPLGHGLKDHRCECVARPLLLVVHMGQRFSFDRSHVKSMGAIVENRWPWAGDKKELSRQI